MVKDQTNSSAHASLSGLTSLSRAHTDIVDGVDSGDGGALVNVNIITCCGLAVGTRRRVSKICACRRFPMVTAHAIPSSRRYGRCRIWSTK
nr:hypothetical protein CFP56_67374 [Quercus suber]